MRLTAFADAHGRLPVVEPCDVLVIAGDLCPNFNYNPDLDKVRQAEWLDTAYRAWEAQVPARHILYTPGNHDWVSHGLPPGLRARMGVDEEFTVMGKRFWLTPWVSPVCGWNYMLERRERRKRFDLIPTNLDVLVAHSPAHKILDRNHDGEHIGCEELRQLLYHKKPEIYVFGHCHEGRRDGDWRVHGRTHCYNVSIGSWGCKPVTIRLATALDFS